MSFSMYGTCQQLNKKAIEEDQNGPMRGVNESQIPVQALRRRRSENSPFRIFWGKKLKLKTMADGSIAIPRETRTMESTKQEREAYDRIYRKIVLEKGLRDEKNMATKGQKSWIFKKVQRK